MEQRSDDVFEQTKLDDGVYEQIKDFDRWKLTEEQQSLIDKLILDEELKNNYDVNGLCKKCKQPRYSYYWCQCCPKIFQQNFQNWTSGNHDVDKFIQNMQLKAKDSREAVEWIEYDGFENIEYLAKGGFGTTFKAIWKDGPIEMWDSVNNQWKRERTYIHHPNHPVALKCLHNSRNVTTEFLSEIEAHIISVKDSNLCIVRCYGITKEPETNNFMMVMEYAQHGSLRQHLDNSFNSLNWHDKLFSLSCITCGLRTIHKKGLIHQDFHCGNILNNECGNGWICSLITDLGLCKPANVERSQSGDKKIYGVLPYVAPEVLRGKEYTQESDIYGFGIIVFEFCTGLPPYHDVPHDEFLAIKICQGLRPKSNYKIPQLILDIIQQCWDADPLKRPKANELDDLFIDLRGFCYQKGSLFNQQIKEVDEMNKQLPHLTIPSTNILAYATHPQAIYTSKLLDFKNLPEPKNADGNDNSFEAGYSESIKIDFANLNIGDESS